MKRRDFFKLALAAVGALVLPRVKPTTQAEEAAMGMLAPKVEMQDFDRIEEYIVSWDAPLVITAWNDGKLIRSVDGGLTWTEVWPWTDYTLVLPPMHIEALREVGWIR